LSKEKKKKQESILEALGNLPTMPGKGEKESLAEMFLKNHSKENLM